SHPGSLPTFELMQALQALGYAVTFVPHDLEYIDRQAEALETAGFFCLPRTILSSMHGFLEEHGVVFDLVVLCGISTAYHLVDSVRGHCREAALLFEATALGVADATEKATADIVRRADLTLVSSAAEREMLAREVPEALVYDVSLAAERGSSPRAAYPQFAQALLAIGAGS